MATNSMELLDWLRKQLESADVDLLRAMLEEFAEKLMGAEANLLCGAEYGERDTGRVNSRNGYRGRRWDTRLGTIDLQIPKLRRDSYYPAWLLQPWRRAEEAMIQVIAESYLLGVSTRRMNKLVQALGLEGISKSQVSKMAKELDEQVETFRTRSLDEGPYTYVWLDAHSQRVRERGRVVNVAVVLAISVNADGRREILGCDILTEETEVAWTAFLRGLVDRGLTGVQLVISDAHKGLKNAIAMVLTGTGWQRCRTHFMQNLLSRIPKAAQGDVGNLVRSIFAQPSARTVREQHGRVVEELEESFPQAAELLEDSGPEILAFADFPKEHWNKIWSNNPLERLNREVRRRTNVVGIFPGRESSIRLIGALLAEQHDEWIAGKRYMSVESLAKARLTVVSGQKEGSDREQLATVAG